jgi:hypothetical protein
MFFCFNKNMHVRQGASFWKMTMEQLAQTNIDVGLLFANTC